MRCLAPDIALAEVFKAEARGIILALIREYFSVDQVARNTMDLLSAAASAPNSGAGCSPTRPTVSSRSSSTSRTRPRPWADNGPGHPRAGSWRWAPRPCSSTAAARPADPPRHPIHLNNGPIPPPMPTARTKE